MKVLVVMPDGSAELQDDVDANDGDVLRAIIGGWLELVSVGTGWHAFLDEEGKLKGLGVNLAATGLAHGLGWPRGDVLCGPVIFLGDGQDGEEADVPQAVIDEARQMQLL